MFDAKAKESNTIEKQNKMLAERIAAACGIPPGLKGFGYIIDAALVYESLGKSLSAVYAYIANLRGAVKKSVEHDIEYAMAMSPDAAGIISEIFGANISRKDCNTAFFIAALAKLIAHANMRWGVYDA